MATTRRGPHHRGYMGGYPTAIQSFIQFSHEEQSNNAQSCPSLHHTFEDFNHLRGSHPWVSPLLSPGSCHTETCVAAAVAGTAGMVGGVRVYPGWYTRVYNQGCIPYHTRGVAYPPGIPPTLPYPGGSMPTMVHTLSYLRVVYARMPLFHPFHCWVIPGARAA